MVSSKDLKTNATAMKEVVAVLIYLVIGEEIKNTRAHIFEASNAVIRFYKQGHESKQNYIVESNMTEFHKTEEYDFIVVGGGTAGCIIASRLSEVSMWKVLLLEAGGDETFQTEVPFAADYLQRSRWNWKDATTAQRGACGALRGRRCPAPSGKLLGGTSAINHMLYSRGNEHDHNRWQEAGNRGWSYANVFFYYLKSENVSVPGLMDSLYHSTGGYLNVDNIPYDSPLAAAFLRAGTELGYPVRDPNGDFQTGFSRVQSNIKDGSRVSASKAFLRPVQTRGNLHILMNSHVVRVIIDPKTKQATGVQFLKDLSVYTARARKEVILAAGVIGSPQILMLSGVGPSQHLAQVGIPLIKDLRVGHNLQDQVRFLGLNFLVDSAVSAGSQRLSSPVLARDYAVRGTGPLTAAGGVEALAYLRVGNATAEDRPDVAMHFVGGSLAVDEGNILTTVMGMRQDVYTHLYGPIAKLPAWTVWPAILHPKSRGDLRLNSSDPWARPLINPNYLSHPEDVSILVEGIKMAIRIGASQAFRKYGSRLHGVAVPGCEGLEFGSDPYWTCAAGQASVPMHNMVGTCKMGPESDAGAVVSPELRVHGIKRLRVGDASVMPEVTSGGTNAPTMMIGEKLSDMIKQTWARPTATY